MRRRYGRADEQTMVDHAYKHLPLSAVEEKELRSHARTDPLIDMLRSPCRPEDSTRTRLRESVSDGPMDLRTNGRTGTSSYRDVWRIQNAVLSFVSGCFCHYFITSTIIPESGKQRPIIISEDQPLGYPDSADCLSLAS